MWKPISDPVKDRMDYPSAEDFLKRFTEAMERSSGDLMTGLFIADGIYELDPFLEPVLGSNAIYEQMNRQAKAYESVEFTIERFWVVTSTVLASFHATYTEPNRREHPIRVHGFLTFEMHTGKIARLRRWSEGRTDGSFVDWIARER